MSYRRPFDRPLTLLRWPDTNPRLLARSVRFWLRYWRSYRREENLGPVVPFVWRGAWRRDPHNRSNDRVKYG